MCSRHEILSRHLPFRLTAIEGLATMMAMRDATVLRLQNNTAILERTILVVGNKASTHCNAVDILLVNNAIVDAGFTSARVLMELFGFGCRRVAGNTAEYSLHRQQSRREDDIALEQLGGVEFNLDLILSLTESPFAHEADAPSVETILAYMIHVANKGVAHLTNADIGGRPGHVMVGAFFIELAVQKLIYQPNHFDIPDYRHWSSTLLPKEGRDIFEECRKSLHEWVMDRIPQLG